jgi:hypothetical protein
MLKKPPKFLTPEERDIHLSMGEMNLEEDHDKNAAKDSDSEGAVGGKSAGESLDDDDDDDDDDFGDFQEAS